MNTAQAVKATSPLPVDFLASPMQLDIFSFVEKDRRSAVIEAVAGSGKSTTIVHALLFIPEWENVIILAFNAAIVKEMKAKVEKLGKEMGRSFRNVRVATFHSLGFGAVCKRLGVQASQIKTDQYKLRDLTRELWSEPTQELYADFCCDLVSLAKGQGVGPLIVDTQTAWQDIIDHHDLYLDSEDATIDRAIALCRELLARSNDVAKSARWIDFDDMLYLPLLWGMTFFKQDKVFVDEAQDVNPVRRAICRKVLKTGGRLFACGDRCQAIYGFTGADSEAMTLLADAFNAVELPLTVSYRCPIVAEDEVKHLVPYFSTNRAPTPDKNGVLQPAILGEVLKLSVQDALPRLDASAVILCRNTAPLVSLAYALMRRRIPCRVLGREIGQGLVSLIKKMRGKTIDHLKEKLEKYEAREVAAFMEKKKEQKAAGVQDRVACVMTFIDALSENERTVSKLIRSIEAMFEDKGAGVLTLSTLHKAKGREWETVAIYRLDLLPSPFARQPWQHKQELHLEYVGKTRFKRTMIYLQGELPK